MHFIYCAFFHFCSKEHSSYELHNCTEAYVKVHVVDSARSRTAESTLFFVLQDIRVPVCPLCNQPVPVNRGEDPNNKVISGLIYGLLLASFSGPAQLPLLAVLQVTASDGSWAGPGNEASLLSCLILEVIFSGWLSIS